MKRVLVIRLSAIGDVAMSVPVIYSAARANPDDTFTVVTQAFLIPIFINRPKNVELLGINIKGTEKSVWGMLRFASAISREKYDLILDLHRVIRTRAFTSYFRLRGKRVYTINKGRNERKQLTRKEHKILRPLRQMTQRYADVFRRAGLNYTDTFQSLYESLSIDLALLNHLVGEKTGRWIGIAPFAKHRGKAYPLDRMEQIVKQLAKHTDTKVFLFGGGDIEQETLERWADEAPTIVNTAGKYGLNVELMLISRMDLLVSMDSANMHFASLAGTRVLSVWGATHPYAGFYGYNQRPDDTVQTDLPCRPCSIFGNKPCYRGDWACMETITPDTILNKIEDILS